MRIMAVDPGNEKSGWCLYDDGTVIDSGVHDNYGIQALLRGHAYELAAFEMVASYGMAVGREIFETCVWTGRLIECTPNPDGVLRIFRRDVKLHLCGSARAKDGNVRQAILDLYPATGGGKTPQIGTVKQPGPLYGVSTHAWAALGVAITAEHQVRQRMAA